MSDLEDGVADQYSAYDVLSRIKAGLEGMGHDPERIEPDVLKAVDEFHIGGAEATAHLLDQLAVHADTRVLDIGSGIGGPARLVAGRFGAKVTGVDLTPAFVETARALSAMCGVSDRVGFEVGSATSLPFPDRAFDLALMLHVGMNIPDKAAIFREARRVLSERGVFAVYDVMRTGAGELAYPVPWADSAAISSVATPEDYRTAAAQAGFGLRHEENRSAIALDFFSRIQAAAQEASAQKAATEKAAPPPLGLHNLMGPTIGEKMKNMIGAIKAGTIAPVQMIFHVA